MENHMLLGDHCGEVDKPARLLSFEEHFAPDADLSERHSPVPKPYYTVKPLRLGEVKESLPKNLVVNLLAPQHPYHTSIAEQQKVERAIKSAQHHENLRAAVAKTTTFTPVNRSKLPPPIMPPDSYEPPRTYATKKRAADDDAYVVKKSPSANLFF